MQHSRLSVALALVCGTVGLKPASQERDADLLRRVFPVMLRTVPSGDSTRIIIDAQSLRGVGVLTPDLLAIRGTLGPSARYQVSDSVAALCHDDSLRRAGVRHCLVVQLKEYSRDDDSLRIRARWFVADSLGKTKACTETEEMTLVFGLRPALSDPDIRDRVIRTLYCGPMRNK